MSNFLISQIIATHALRLKAGADPKAVAADLHKFSASLMAPTPCTSTPEDDEIYELASLEASELDSPNSPDYDRIHEAIVERIYAKRYPS